MLVKHAIKTAIAASILAEIFRHSDLAHIQYPVMGLVGTMLSSNLGDTVKAGWARLAGAAVGGVFAALVGSTLGFNPVTGGLIVVAVGLFCEAYQREALISQALTVAVLITADPALGGEPWRFTFERVVDTSIGVMLATVVNLLFWADNPRQVLSNNLVKILQGGDRLFQAIIEGALKGDLQIKTGVPLAQMQEMVQQSESLLSKSMYGFVGKQLAQQNWSDLIAVEYRFCRHLLAMSRTFKGRKNQLICKFTEELKQLVHQVSTVCNVITTGIQSDGAAMQVSEKIPILERYFSRITHQIDCLRLSGEIKEYELGEIIQVCRFLNILMRFTQELDQLTLKLRDRQKTASQPANQWRFQLHPIPIKQVKYVIKIGIASGLTLAIADFAQFPLGFWAPLIVAITMQSTLEKSIRTGMQTMISVGTGAIVASILINTLGSHPFTIGLGVALTILICSYLGFNQGYILGCFLVIYASMMQDVLQSDRYIWGEFFEVLLGVVTALIFSVLFWRETASQTLNREISQTLVKLGTLYETIVNYYLQGLDSSVATAQLSEKIQQSLQTQSLLQGETKQEPVYGFMASKAQRKWNFLLSYEKTLLGNILSLQSAAGQGDSVGISQFLRKELQEAANLTVLGFKGLAKAVGSQPTQRHFAILLSSFDVAQQRIEPQRTLNSSYKYELEDAIAFFSVLSTMKEIALDLNQMAIDWPAS